MFGKLTNVTSDEALSRLKQQMLHRDALLSVKKVTEIADLLRLHFGMPDLQLGVTALDYPRENAVNHRYRIRYNLLAGEFDSILHPDFDESLYFRAMSNGELIVVEDLALIKEPTRLEQALLENGIRSIIIAPLLSKEDQVIGLVELASSTPYELNAFVESRFRDLAPLFRMTLARSRDDIDNRLDAIIRERYTSLHQSVEWRFMEAAFNILENQDKGEEYSPEAIDFEEVYPLYGQADIVSSSQLRNESIQADLFENLREARVVMAKTLELLSFPLVSQIILKIDQALAIIPETFNNSHETSIAELILKEINPLVQLIGRENPELCPLTKQYYSYLDPQLKLIYRKRKAYEQSVSMLNKQLGQFFEQRDRQMQASLPHYFEQYKTDGVEYELYAGNSLLQHQQFSELHLRNLRLSQLIDMADATRMIATLGQELPMKLETAQLVFAYTNPLNIAFRMDEKRFDVDGAYNVRYEILKKRIDKATINGKSERLTKAGHVSIVYLHDKDETEYEGYLDYLQKMGYVEDEPERLLLDPLQSVQGLRAFRFKVRIS